MVGAMSGMIVRIIRDVQISEDQIIRPTNSTHNSMYIVNAEQERKFHK